MTSLAAEVPGDLGRVIRAMLGIGVETSVGAFINPPAKPIWWATELLAVCCDAYGQSVDRAVPVGACLELFGIAAAVLDAAHDGHEELLSRYVGTGVALSVAHNVAWDHRIAIVSNASVALIGLFWRALLEHGPTYGVEQQTLLNIGRLLAKRLVQICYGQHLDLTAGCDSPRSLDEYELIIINKTGEIDGLACEVAAILAGAEDHREVWHILGLERALVQQLYDDYVDLAEDLTGGGQINHPVLYGLTVGSNEQHEDILALLNAARAGGADASSAVSQLGDLLRSLGAEHYTLACMLVHRDKATAALQVLQLPPNAENWLQDWIMQVDPLHSSVADHTS